MLYCINPLCNSRVNPDGIFFCQDCDSPLLICGRYQITRQLSKPGQNLNQVFEVVDLRDGDKIKVLKVMRPTLYQYAEREAAVLGRKEILSIPHLEQNGFFCLPIEGKEYPCLVMEKIDGCSLVEWLDQGNIVSESIAIDWLKQLAVILEQLHGHCFIHRDIKPDNIILKPDGKLVIIDFGTVRSVTQTYQGKLSGDGATTIFSGGYTPLEQMQGKAFFQSDFYALGCTIIYLLTKRKPSSLPTKNRKIQWKNFVSVSPALTKLIDRLIAPRVEDRPIHASSILQSIEQLHGVQRRRRRWLWGGGMGTLIIASVGFFTFANYTRAGSLLEQGQQALELRQYVEAEDIFRRLLAVDETNSEAHHGVSLACRFQEKLDCATVHLRRAIELGDDNVFARYSLAFDLDKMGYIEAAIKEYEIALDQVSENAPSLVFLIHNNLSRLFNSDRQYEKARILSEEGVQLALAHSRNDEEYVKHLAALYKNLGWAFLYLGENQQALGALEESIRLTSNLPSSHCLLAKVLKQMNTPARKSWQNCLTFPDKSDLMEVQRWKEEAQLELDLNYEQNY